MSPHPDINDHIDSTSTTDEQKVLSTNTESNTNTDIEARISNESEPETKSKHLRIVNTFFTKRTHT